MSEPSSGRSFRSFWGTVQCALICATIVILAYRLSPRTLPARRLWLPTVVQKDGSQSALAETRQMNFWTPSVKTKDYLPKSDTPTSPSSWQILSSDEPVTQFGMMLHSNANILGYRRMEAWGHGRSEFKPGWWWTVNVTTNYSVAELGQAYQTFWKSSAPVFVEVVDNRGSE